MKSDWSSLEWPIYDDYRIEHLRTNSLEEWTLQALGGVVRRYNPLDYPQVLGEYAKLRKGDETGKLTDTRGFDSRLLKFTKLWGLPGEQPTAEAVDWVFEEAWRVRLALLLYGSRHTGDHEKLTRLLEVCGTIEGSGHQRHLTVPITDPEETVPPLRIPWEDPASMAESVIAHILNCALRHVRRRVDTEPLRVSTYAPSLIGAIYWRLADTITTGHVAACQNPRCGTVFAVTHGRQKYCPPPPTWASTTGSPCGAADRKRRQRERQKKGG